MNTENIFKSFNNKICKNCGNKNCQEELRVKIDGSIKCEKYKPKPIGALIRAIRIGD